MTRRRTMKKEDYVRSIELYGDYYKKNKKVLTDLLEILKRNNQIILWGAGLKGKAFVQIIDGECKYISCIVDMDEKKQGMVLTTGHIVCGIEEINEKAIILIVNVKYYISICFSILNSGYDIKKLHLVLIDDYINGKITLGSILDNTIWQRRKYYD